MNLSDYINLLYFISIRLKHKGYVECKEVTSNRIAKAHASKLKNVKEAILLPEDSSNVYYCKWVVLK